MPKRTSPSGPVTYRRITVSGITVTDVSGIGNPFEEIVTVPGILGTEKILVRNDSIPVARVFAASARTNGVANQVVVSYQTYGAPAVYNNCVLSFLVIKP